MSNPSHHPTLCNHRCLAKSTKYYILKLIRISYIYHLTKLFAAVRLLLPDHNFPEMPLENYEHFSECLAFLKRPIR
jgi:hypothetical protein